MEGLKVVAIAGPIASGKTTIAKEVFEKHGYRVYSIGQIIKEIITTGKYSDEYPVFKKYLTRDPSREVLLEAGKEARRVYGERIFIDLIIRDATEKGHDKIVIDGIRGAPEIRAVQDLGGITVYLEVGLEELYRRYRERNKDIDKDRSFSTFHRMLAREEEDFGVFSTRELNDVIFNNNRPLEEARRIIENLLC